MRGQLKWRHDVIRHILPHESFIELAESVLLEKEEACLSLSVPNQGDLALPRIFKVKTNINFCASFWITSKRTCWKEYSNLKTLKTVPFRGQKFAVATPDNREQPKKEEVCASF